MSILVGIASILVGRTCIVRNTGVEVIETICVASIIVGRIGAIGDNHTKSVTTARTRTVGSIRVVQKIVDTATIGFLQLLLKSSNCLERRRDYQRS